MSRRDLLAGGAAAAASMSPGVQAAVSALANEPVKLDLVRRGKHTRVTITVGIAPSWTLDTASFAGSPKLILEKGERSSLLRLTGARFPGTLVVLNLEANIPNQQKGTIKITVNQVKLIARFDQWLKGEAKAKGAATKDDLITLFGGLANGTSLDVLDGGTLAYAATGELSASASMDLTTNDATLQIEDLSIASRTRSGETLVNGTNRAHSTMKANKRDSWTGEVALEATSGWIVSGSVDAFDTWEAECHENGQMASKFTGKGSLAVAMPGSVTLQATDPTLTLLGTGQTDVHFASQLHEDGDWIHHEGISHHARPVTTEPFILSTNEYGELEGNPPLHSRTTGVSLPDAFVTFGTTLVPNLILSQQRDQGQGTGGRPPQRPPTNPPTRPPTRPPTQPPPQRPPVILKPPVIQNPPGQRPPIVKKDDPILKVATSQVWIPSIEIVRPQDFLNLKFEFANWHLVSSVGTPPYFEREMPSRPAYIVVEFPPQAIGEQSMFAGHQFETPVRTLLAGPTRLVFFVPASQKTIKFSLTEDNGLLDWDSWSLSVAPAAFSTFSGKVSVDPSWQHPIQDIKIGASREFELLAERTPTVTEKLASMFRIQRQTTPDQRNNFPIIQFQQVRQRTPNLIHLKPNIREVRQTVDPTKIIPAVPNGRTGPVYRYNTNIEIPAQIQMSPDENAHFFHVRDADTGAIKIGGPKKSALWHTRLGTFAQLNGQTVRAESSDDGEWFYTMDSKGKLGPYKSSTPLHPHLRAIDSTDFDKKNNLGVDFTITRDQRIALVMTMSERSATPSQDSPPFIADRLMLTSLGGFLKGSWTWGDGAPPHNIVGWRHWSTLGREQFVYIREAGFLVPTGHRVDKVTVSQRRFVPSGKGVIARLETKTYLIIMQPLVELESTHARKMGFSQIVCKTKTTPDLDFANVLTLAGTSKVFEFSMVGTDMDGNQVSWTQPASFVLFNDGIKTSTNWDNISPVIAKSGGQAVSFAPSQNASHGTKFPCKDIWIKPTPGTPNKDKNIPAFRPTMFMAHISVPAVEQYLPSGSKMGSTAVQFADGYAASGFTGGPEVFLKLMKSVSAEFSDGKKFGGMVNPGVKFDCISRKHGPVPNPSGNSVSPSQYALVTSEEFASTDALEPLPEIGKLLGVVSIWDLLPNSIDLGGNGSDAPKFKVAKVFSDDKFGEVGSGSPSNPIIGAVASFSWHPTLKEWAPAGWTFKEKCFTKRGSGAELRIDAAYYQIMDSQGTNFQAGSSYFLKAGIYNFKVNACDQVHILVDKIEFSSQSGSNAKIKIDIEDIQFHEMLTFVGKLQSILAPGTKGYHFESSTPTDEQYASNTLEPVDGLEIKPILDINGNGLTVGFSLSLPTIGIGVVTVMNIAVLSELILPWFGDALTFRFAFCKRDAPFAVSVYGIAGGGFLGIEVTPGGIKSIEGAIEFGACVSINLGVASGSISLMAGFYFKYEPGAGTTLTGYVRIVGEVDVLGIISASLELYLGLNYNTQSKVLSGDASITIRISLFCFHKSVSVHCHKEFAGGGSDAELGTTWASMESPPELYAERERTLFTNSVTSQQFKNYCSAFGGNA